MDKAIKSPDSLKEHEPKFKPSAWQDYSLQELGNWVHLFHKRAEHRSDAEKRAKDLLDARNYWRMMGSWLDAAEKAES